MLSVHNLQMHSAPFTKILQHDKMLDALEDIMGTSNIALHHTKAHVKPPGKGAPYLMHQVSLLLHNPSILQCTHCTVCPTEIQNRHVGCLSPGARRNPSPRGFPTFYELRWLLFFLYITQQQCFASSK